MVKNKYNLKPIFLYNLKILRNFSRFISYNALQFYSSYYKPYRIFQINGLRRKAVILYNNNFFYRIKRSMLRFRYHFLLFFGIKFCSHKTANDFFELFKHLTPLNYLWFLEHSAKLFLIKTKVTSTLTLAHYYVRNSYFFSSCKEYLGKWVYLDYNSVNQVLLNNVLLNKVKLFLKNKKKSMIGSKNKLKKVSKYFRKRFRVFTTDNYKTIFNRMQVLRFVESDYKILTFIALPLLK